MAGPESDRSPAGPPQAPEASTVLVLDPDARAGRQVQLGFEREGIPVVAPAIPPDLGALELDAGLGIALVGGADGRAVELVRATRQLLTARAVDVPIVALGPAGGSSGATSGGGDAARAELVAAGADEVLARPAFLRDVVTIGRILRGVPAAQREHVAGSLAETTGVYTLVRALAALGRSAVLTLVRGLRRGEIRFYRGEITSAHVGLIHGQAAFHQLLLWTDARFDFSREDVVRRQQIPMSADELFADAERFLEGVRETAELLSPSMVLEQDVQRVNNLGKQVPTEVHGVLRMFDGHRVLADILEDSPYRVFETLRVAEKALEAGLLRVAEDERPRASWRTVLAIDEWLVGSETRDAVVERTSAIDTNRATVAPPAGATHSHEKKRRRKKARRPSTPLPIAQPKPGDIDWGALVPRVIGGEIGPLSGVVPAMDVAGEIDIASRDRERERLEALMDTDKRNKIFASEVGIEPSVVVEQGDTDEWERAEWQAKATAEAEAKATAEAEAAAAERARSEAEAAAATAAEQARVEAEAEAERAAAQRRVAAVVEKMRIERALHEEAEAQQLEAAARSAAAEEAHAYAARVKAAAEAKRVEAGRVEAERVEAARAAAAPIAPAAPSMLGAPPAPDAPDAEPAAPSRPSDAASLAHATEPPERVVQSERVVVAETPAMTVSVAEHMTVAATISTAIVTSTQTATVHAAAPVATDDEPSDGTVRAMIAAPKEYEPPRREPSEPHGDGPPVSETTGEITREIERLPAHADVAEPSILVGDLDAPVTATPVTATAAPVTAAPVTSAPVTVAPVVGSDDPLVADLAAAHSAIAAVVAKAAAAPPTPDAASASKELDVAEVRRAVVELTEAEETFFKNADRSEPHPKPRVESFDDLDEGYRPPKFWDRVFGRKPPAS